MKPTVGRIVHWYWKPDVSPLAAIIVAVLETGDTVLRVLHEDNSDTTGVFPFSVDPKAGCWSWPPRV